MYVFKAILGDGLVVASLKFQKEISGKLTEPNENLICKVSNLNMCICV